MRNDFTRRRHAPHHGWLRGMAPWCALAGALAVTGCSLAPRHETPSLPVASAYPADTGSQPGATSDGPIAPEIAWRDYFSDPQLKNFHRLRQSDIDEELFDVISGFEAMAGGKSH